MPTCTEVLFQVLLVELYSSVFVSSDLEYKDRDYPLYLENMAPPLVDLNDAMQAVCKVRTIERFSHVLEMKTREEKRNNKRTEIKRFDWFIERVQKRVAFRWLNERSREKNFMPKNFLEFKGYFALTSYCNTIGQSNNAFSILQFSLAGKQRGQEAKFGSFHPLTDKTNNEHFLKLYFSRSYENCNIKRITLLTFKAFDKFLFGLLLRNVM